MITKPFRKFITINCIHNGNQCLLEETKLILKYL